MPSQLYVVEVTGVTGENHCLTSSHWHHETSAKENIRVSKMDHKD